MPPVPRLAARRDHLVVCGDDALAVRVIEELTTTYGEDVTVLLRSREAGQGPRIARMPKVRIIERAELDTSAFTAAGVQSARSLALLRQDDLGNFHAALRPGDQPRSAPRGLTTFLLSAANAGWMTKATGDAWLGYAFAYGGLAQLLAGMWEFRNRNVFGATAFGTYGGFWIGLGLWALLVAPAPAAPPGTSALAAAHLAAVHAAAAQKDLGWILLAFAIFNTYMLLWSTQVNIAVFGVFLTLEATEIILFAGFFAANTNVIKAGGYVGVLTALVAWYASAAGVINGMRGSALVPVGKPFGMAPAS